MIAEIMGTSIRRFWIIHRLELASNKVYPEDTAFGWLQRLIKEVSFGIDMYLTI